MPVKLVRLIVLAPSVLAPALAIAQTDGSQFDTICTGVDPLGQQHTYEFRIDLNARQWCPGDCLKINPLTSDDSKITMSTPVEEAQGSSSATITLDRRTGDFLAAMDNNAARAIRGRCFKAPFKAFNQNVF